MAGSQLRRPKDILGEALLGLGASLFIVDVVARQLDGANAQIVGQLDGLLHDLQAPGNGGGVVAAQGVLAVAAQADAADGQRRVVHGLHQRQALGLRPGEALELLV